MLPPAQRPDTMRISFVGGDQTYDFKLNGGTTAPAENTWDIPKDAREARRI